MFYILLLEDDELFSSTLEDFLSEEGFCVDITQDGHNALELNYKKNYDLYIFDINVPKINGLELLENLRSIGDDTPTIFLTSYKDKETIHSAFKNGCDDYMKKPVDLDELLFRIKALLKRNNKSFENIYLKDDIVFNPNQKRLYQNEQDLNLPSKVIELLELFVENRQKIVTKDMIVSRLWNTSEDYSEGSIRVYVNNIKKILGKNSIKNIKGIGYKVEF